jgi:hypothetical protein
MISELLREARLLASELNQGGGDAMAIVLDPLAATTTAERRFNAMTTQPNPQAPQEQALELGPTAPEREISSKGPLNPLKRQASAPRLQASLSALGRFSPGTLPTKVHACMPACGVHVS